MWGTPVLSAGVGAGFRITPTHVGNTFGTIKKAMTAFFYLKISMILHIKYTVTGRHTTKTAENQAGTGQKNPITNSVINTVVSSVTVLSLIPPPP